MQSSILMFVFMGLISLSCQNQTNLSNMGGEKTKIKLFGLSNEHPNKESMEWLLNNYEEAFIASKDDGETLEHENLIQKKYNFHTELSNTSLILIFCNNQQAALTIAETNFSFNDNNQKYGVNGAVLFVVKGKEKSKVNRVLSWFSGEE
jgi:hypothetical protein